MDFVGLWVNTDKVSEDGYAIPWVSDELLTHLRYQREWVQRFSPYPTMHGAKQAQGHRNTPLTWEERDPKFYCLFRDLSAEKGVDPSLPVSRQKLLKLWGALCLEVQTRLNSRLGPDRTKVILVKGGSTANQPMALYDLHTLRVSGITDLLDRGVPLNIVSQYVAGHATYMMTLWYDSPAPGALREALKQAHESAGQRASSLPSFSLEDVDSLRAHLVSLDDARHPGRFTGFDALDENGGLMLVRQAGICPGTRCEEGGLDESGRAVPVPFGDRGPSCPQCRFWLTGPAFLLGQVIEGNQLILKIRRKVVALARLRERIVEARDEGANSRGDVLAAQADVEERQLNDMLTEWWHRMRAYEASLRKLEDYRAYRQTSGTDANPVMLVANSHSEALSYGFRQATDLELRHFLSTCEELVPDFTSESLGARQDIELAVSKFLAMNGDAELATLFFQLDDTQRVAVANLTVELMLRTAATPGQASQVLEGRAPLSSLPEVQRGIEQLLGHSRRRTVQRKADPIGVERAT